MKSFRGIILSCLIFSAVLFSCGTDENGNVVVIPDLTHILIISNDDGDNAWIQTNFPLHMDGLEFSTWKIVDSIPTLQKLKEFDVILLFENGNNYIADSIGDRIYEYVMEGGNLVEGTFIYQHNSDAIYGTDALGLLETIDPIIPDNGNAYSYDSTGTWIDHPLTRGLDTIYSEYGGGYDSLRAGATAVAWWKNGEILMAYNKPNGRIVALTLWPAEPSDYNGNFKGFYRAWENALLYAAWGGTRTGKTVSVPEPVQKVTGKIFDKKRPQNGGSR